MGYFFLLLSFCSRSVGRSMSIVDVYIYARQHFTEFFPSSSASSSPFSRFFSFTLTYFRCIRSLHRQLKRICTRPSTVEAVRGYYFSLVLTLTLSPVLLFSAIIFSFSSQFFSSRIQHYSSTYIYTLKVFSLYEYTTEAVIILSR